jgi:hypothetical protein
MIRSVRWLPPIELLIDIIGNLPSSFFGDGGRRRLDCLRFRNGDRGTSAGCQFRHFLRGKRRRKRRCDIRRQAGLR